MDLPTDRKELLATALSIIEACKVSQGIRAAYCRQLNMIIETGRQDGTKSLINKLHHHVDRLASHLFSPTDLRFTIDYENEYPKQELDRARVAARLLTRDWERTNTDMLFGQGVFEALKYGAAILKQWVQQEGPDEHPQYYRKLIMPWCFGVYNEAENDLSRQPALLETTLMTLPEIWRRIHHLPDAEKLFETIKSGADKGKAGDDYNSFFHQVLSTSTLNTGNTGMTRPVPGGIVQLNNDPNYAMIGPEVGVDLIKFHELWIWGKDDYVTLQIVEPDILVAPSKFVKPSNLLIQSIPPSGLHPYTLIQPNQTSGYFWGRPEVADLIEPQGLLSAWADDIKRLFGLQIDKILAFNSQDGITDEAYDQFRQAGWINTQGGSVTDLTPKFPEQALQMLEMLMKVIDMLGGFDNILSGQGEQGVRAGVHADTLLKTASPTLRDRSLLVERQCAEAGDKRLRIMEAKDNSIYWTDGSSQQKMDETSFLLDDLYDDRRVAVDSHSGSPIFADDHQQLIAFGLKAGIVDGHYAIDNLPYPSKELLHQTLTHKQEQEALLLKTLSEKDPEGFAKMLEKRSGGGHK